MEKSKIDWTDDTWNPISGCYHGCEYCYAREMTKRFGKNLPDLSDFAIKNKGLHLLDNRIDSTPYPFGFEPTFHAYLLDKYANKKGRNIFVCSMADLFGSWVPDSWIEEVFKACEKAPQHNYLFLTKNPKRYGELRAKGIMRHSENMWYGYSMTNNSFIIPYVREKNVFVSIEPILEEIHIPYSDLGGCIDWVIIGAETGRRKNKVIPKREWIERIVYDCHTNKIPIFMKSSLADIWGEPLIQEFPKELRK